VRSRIPATAASLKNFKILVDLDVRQPLRAIARHEGRVVVDLLARELPALRHAQRSHPAAGIRRRAREHLEIAALHQVRDVDQLERHAQIRFVGTIAAHGFGIGHARQRIRQLHLQHFLEQEPYQPLHQSLDVALIEKGSLDVELRELRLAIRAQILIAKTAHDLVVAVEARDHQELLVDLRRLRQREELAGVGAARHQVIARTLGRRLGKHRGLDVDEARVVQVTPHRACDAMAQ
jgi:hypothetical protein